MVAFVGSLVQPLGQRMGNLMDLWLERGSDHCTALSVVVPNGTYALDLINGWLVHL